MKALDGEPVFVRPGTSDLTNAADYMIHRPPLPGARDRRAESRRIAEIGSNIGAALTGLAFAYPESELLGVEPDPGNLGVAEMNVARFGDRVKLIRAGIWDENCMLVIDEGSGGRARAGRPPRGARRAPKAMGSCPRGRSTACYLSVGRTTSRSTTYT